MQRLLSQKVEFDTHCEVITSELENKLKAYIQEAQSNVVEQQETVLKYQTELSIALDQHRKTKKNIEDNFTRFCNAKFHTIVPHLEVPELEV